MDTQPYLEIARLKREGKSYQKISDTLESGGYKVTRQRIEQLNNFYNDHKTIIDCYPTLSSKAVRLIHVYGGEKKLTADIINGSFQSPRGFGEKTVEEIKDTLFFNNMPRLLSLIGNN